LLVLLRRRGRQLPSEAVGAVPVFPGEVVSTRCLGMGLNIFLTAPCAQIQEFLYWECEVFKASTAAPLDLPAVFSKASVVVQDEIQMCLLKDSWNKVKSRLIFTEISPSVT